jgi:hypothetical protein
LLENIDGIFQQFDTLGLESLADLRKRLKTPKQLTAFADESGICAEYLMLLRREIESYFPKSFPLRDFDWIPEPVRHTLEEAGYTNSQKLYEALDLAGQLNTISATYGIEPSLLRTLSGLVDITRIQWMSPLSARMMYEAGYTSSGSIRTAVPDTLCKMVDSVNRKNGYFKGKIGLRDIKRLIHAAQYVD